MGAYGVTVEKEMTFRGSPELFSNVYHYHIDAPVEADYQALADAVVARDRLVYPAGFAYKTVRVYGPTDGPASENLIRLVQDLTGGGSKAVAGPNAYQELAYLVTMPAGRSETTQRRIYFKKFIHVASLWGSGDNASSGLVSTASRTFAEDWMEGNKSVGTIPSFVMCTPRDQLVPQFAEATCAPFLHIRQLKQ